MTASNIDSNADTRFMLMEQSMKHMNDRFEQSMQHMSQSIQNLSQSMQRLESSIDGRFDKVDREIKEVYKELKSEIRSNFFWTMGVMGAFFAIVAHGLHWF